MDNVEFFKTVQIYKYSWRGRQQRARSGQMTDVTDEDEGRAPMLQAGSTHPSRSIVLADNCIDSRDLFKATREITIAHAGEIYRLRLTARNKLILTK